MHQAACIFSEVKSGAMQVHQASRIFSEIKFESEREVENAVSFRSAGHESLDVKTGTGPHEKPRICRIQNPDIPRAGRGGVARMAEWRGEQGRAEQDADGTVRPGRNRPFDPLAHQRQLS